MSQASFMNWHLTMSEFTWFIKLFVTLLAKKNSFVNWHFMMSQCTWFIKLFVTLYTKNDFFVNWHLTMSQCTWFIKLFITLLTIKIHPWRFLKKVDFAILNAQHDFAWGRGSAATQTNKQLKFLCKKSPFSPFKTLVVALYAFFKRSRSFIKPSIKRLIIENDPPI